MRNQVRTIGVLLLLGAGCWFLSSHVDTPLWPAAVLGVMGLIFALYLPQYYSNETVGNALPKVGVEGLALKPRDKVEEIFLDPNFDYEAATRFALDTARPKESTPPLKARGVSASPFPSGPPRNLVAGESHYADAFKKLTRGNLPRGANAYFSVPVKFQRQMDNPHDKNAFKATVKNHQVGHLPATVAAIIAPKLDARGVSMFELPGVIHAYMIGAKRCFACHAWVTGLDAGLSQTLTTVGELVGSWRPDPGEIRSGLD